MNTTNYIKTLDAIISTIHKESENRIDEILKLISENDINHALNKYRELQKMVESANDIIPYIVKAIGNEYDVHIWAYLELIEVVSNNKIKNANKIKTANKRNKDLLSHYLIILDNVDELWHDNSDKFNEILNKTQ